MPKASYYRTNGTGRDTYISFNNGGCFQPMLKVHSQDHLFIRPKTAVSKTSLKSLHYISDGTGRDSYVQYGDGGLHGCSTPGFFLDEFRNKLRNYQPIKTVCDPYTWTQAAWKTSQARCVSRNANRKVKSCVSRLYFKK